MIYRLSSKFKQIYFTSNRPTPPDGLMPHLSASEYAFRFEELPSNSPSPNFRLFKAPILPEWRMNCPLEMEIVRKSAEIPEFVVWQSGIYVTERVKDIVEKVDTFTHQYWPVEVSIVRKKNKVEVAQQYYRMNVRRYIFIEDQGSTFKKSDFIPSVAYQEDKYIASIQCDKSLRKRIENQPVWQLLRTSTQSNLFSTYDAVVFINEQLFEELSKAEVTGIKEYSKFLGMDTESVAHV